MYDLYSACFCLLIHFINIYSKQCKRQEEEIIKLRRSLDDSARNQDDAMSLARLRHSQEMQVCQDEIDSLKKAKARLVWNIVQIIIETSSRILFSKSSLWPYCSLNWISQKNANTFGKLGNKEQITDIQPKMLNLLAKANLDAKTCFLKSLFV